MSTDVDLEAMGGVADDLDSAGRSLDGTGSAAPGSVDAGLYSPLVMSVLSRLTEGAAGLAEGVVDAGAGVRESMAAYRSVDGSSADGFARLTPGMTR